VVFICIGSATQIFTTGAMMVWTPTYFFRYYQLPPEKAALMAAAFILISGLGMTLCGNVADRLSRKVPGHKLLAAIVYCLASLILLSVAFRLPPGNAQLVLFALGMFTASGIWGPTNAAVANLTPAAIHSTALAVLTLINNLIGLAPGPFVTGLLSDRYGLDVAFQLVPLASIVATLALYGAWRLYERELQQKSSR
jgi:sugar phosphate permease